MNNYAKYIDHTYLKADATNEDIKKLCSEAIEYGFYSVCINPVHVPLAKSYLSNCEVKVCTVVGFPLGANIIETKVFETKKAIEDGADEIDMVINISALKDNNFDYLESEIRSIKSICANKVLKVIIETAYLNKEEIIKITKLLSDVGVNFIKTSTGFASRGASIDDILTIKSVIDTNLEIKASGGIRSFPEFKQFIDLGVKRVGTSNGIKILEEVNNWQNLMVLVEFTPKMIKRLKNILILSKPLYIIYNR